MAYLIGSADTARFNATAAYNSGANRNAIQINGGTADALSPVAEGTASLLSLYISSWGTLADAKFCIYEDDILVEEVLVNASVGTGLVNIAMAGTLAIVNTSVYRIAMYTNTDAALTLFSDAGDALTKRTTSASGNYDTPISPLPDGAYESFNEFYWAIQSSSIPSLRKSGAFTVETTLAGTVTSATLNGQAITVDSHVGSTVTLTDSDGSITTSGEYALVLTDNAAATETITVQVNVYGVTPSDNPMQKDGAVLASLTNVEVRVSAGATLAGSQLFYTATATTDASGNLGNIDLSATAAADTDPVLLSIRTAAGDSIIAAETVGLI